MEDIEQAKLDKIINARPDLTCGAIQAQISAVRDVLIKGDYIDSNWALLFCNKTQRLGAIIYVLRHEEGLPIVDWQPTTYWGSVYSLYEYAPKEVRDAWNFLEGKSPEDIKAINFATGRRVATLNNKYLIEGQISFWDILAEAKL